MTIGRFGVGLLAVLLPRNTLTRGDFLFVSSNTEGRDEGRELANTEGRADGRGALIATCDGTEMTASGSYFTPFLLTR